LIEEDRRRSTERERKELEGEIREASAGTHKARR